MMEGTKVYPLAAGRQGFDTSQKLTPDEAKSLRSKGFDYAIRYLSRKSTPPADDLTADELDAILKADLAVMAVQHVAKSGWKPSEELGIAYGRNASLHAQSVGLPSETSIWLDLEEVSGDATADDVVAYCNAWFREVEAAGYTSGIYVGSNCILDGDQLYWRLKTGRYWRSGSNVPDIVHRGYCMMQRITKGDKVGGVSICRDVTAVDAFGNAPMAVRRETSAMTSMLAAVPLASQAMAFVDRDDGAVLRSLAADRDLAEPMGRLLDFCREKSLPLTARHWAIADFDLRSSEPRLFVFDVSMGTVQAYLCAHGRGSEGPTDDGYASVFSNVIGSNCTSLGVYRCSEPYEGKHGKSMRLDGLEATNANVRARAVVLHGANYVSPEFVAQHGRIGRSDGCFAVDTRSVSGLVDALSGGSLLLAWHRASRGRDLRNQIADDIGSSTAPAGSVLVQDAVAPPASDGGDADLGSAMASETLSQIVGETVWSELEPPPAHATVMPSTAVDDAVAALAHDILDSKRIQLARTHASGKQDSATAYQNIVDTAAGQSARRSNYGTAPGGRVKLDHDMLRGLVSLAELYSFSISELCGGTHDRNSRHYAGCAVDINVIGGLRVDAHHPDVVAFQKHCRDLGATEVLGPGKPNHDTHVHAAWPRAAG